MKEVMAIGECHICGHKLKEILVSKKFKHCWIEGIPIKKCPNPKCRKVYITHAMENKIQEIREKHGRRPFVIYALIMKTT